MSYLVDVNVLSEPTKAAPNLNAQRLICVLAGESGGRDRWFPARWSGLGAGTAQTDQ